jgi:hypothetical protein
MLAAYIITTCYQSKKCYRSSQKYSNIQQILSWCRLRRLNTWVPEVGDDVHMQPSAVTGCRNAGRLTIPSLTSLSILVLFTLPSTATEVANEMAKRVS